MSGRRIRKAITAELLEDAHLGSGVGGQGVDALLARARDNRPVIWATQLEGIIRDAARQGGEDAAATALFGARGGQRGSALFTSLYQSSPGEAETRIWRASARRSYANRAPRTDTLRAIEFVAKGTVFRGEVELPEDETARLERWLGQLPSVGRARATGAGRVAFELSDATPTGHAVDGIADERLVLLLENRDPICIAATATPGNLIPTESFLPGRALCGALVAILHGEGQQAVATGLLDGRLSVSDALPIASSSAAADLGTLEAMPAPLGLKTAKPSGQTGTLPWWGIARAPSAVVSGWEKDDQKLKRLQDDRYLSRDGEGPWVLSRPEIRVRLRNGRSDPAEEAPALFAVSQIAEGTLFLAEITGKPEALQAAATALNEVLEGRRWLRMGRGGVPVEVARAAWAGPRDTHPLKEDTAYLTLTSDLLLRDEKLRWVTHLSCAAVEQQFGVALANDHPRDFQSDVVINGFNGTARLRRLPAAGVKRGSVFKVTGDGVARLSLGPQSPVGERSHEGFGRWRIDADLPGVGADEPPSEPIGKRDSDEEAIARRTKTWFDAYDETKDSPVRKPSLSQWHDLVERIERGDSEAINERLQANTLGGRSWSHKAAKEVLNALKKVADPDQRKRHARFFLRWLSAHEKGERK